MPQLSSEQHRSAQATLAALAASAVAEAWGRFFNVHDLKTFQERLVPVVEGLARQYGRAAAVSALTHYRTQRRAAGVPGRPRLPMPTPATRRDVEESVGRVLTPLYGTPAPKQVSDAEAALESSVEQSVLDQSRRALIGAVHADSEAKGWARVTEPGACYFCAMLASRGAVYRSRDTADFRAHVKQPNGTGGTCRCHVEPFFHVYEPTAQARQWEADWKALGRELGHAPSIRDWRRAFENRERPAGSGNPTRAPGGQE